MTAPRLLAIIPTHNAPEKRDVTGAFHPEAVAWLRLHGADPDELWRFDNAKAPAVRRRQVLRELTKRADEGKTYDAIGFFCHGLWRSIQAGFDTVTAPELAKVLARLLKPVGGRRAVVALYACDAADNGRRDPAPGGDNGFADALRDAFLRFEWAEHGADLSGGWIDAHATTGHTTENPHVRRFDLSPLPHELELGMVGGDWIVSPNDPDGRALWRKWDRALDHDRGTLRLRFPLMTRAEILDELRSVS